MKKRLICTMFAAALFFAPMAQQAAATSSDSSTLVYSPTACMVGASADVALPTAYYSAALDNWYGYIKPSRGSGTADLPRATTYYNMRSASDSDVFFHAGCDITISLDCSQFAFLYNKSGVGSTYTSLSGLTFYMWVALRDTSGSSHWALEKVEVKSTETVSFTIPSDKCSFDITGIGIWFLRGVSSLENYIDDSACIGFKSGAITVSAVPVRTIGFLASILDVINSIFSKIGDVFTAITQLPSQICDLIVEGLKSLFIPSQDDLNSLFDSFGESFKAKLGFLWESGEIVSDFWVALMNTSEAGEVNFPGISLSIAGATFSVPAQSVSLWPSGFDFLKNSVRLGTTSALAFLWLRGLLRRLDAILNPGGD